MPDDLELGADQVVDQPADASEASVGDDLRAAFAESQVERPDEGVADGRARGPDGRFIEKAGDEPAATTEDPAAKAKPAPTQQPAADPAAQPAATTTAAPQHWPEADKAAFAKAPPEVQARWIEREQQFSRAYTEVSQKWKSMEGVHKAFEPHLSAMQQAGTSPEHYTNGWIKVEQRLMARDPQVFAEAVKAYGFDPAAVVAALSGQAAPTTEQEYVDPRVAHLEAQLAELRGAVGQVTGHITTQQEREATAAHNAVLGQIDSFAQEKTADGQLAHPYYAEVEEKMVALASAERHAGREPKLQDLYDSAVWSTPAVRSKVQADQRRADEAERIAKAKTKSAAARTANVSVTGTPSAGRTPTARNESDSVRDALRSAYSEHTTG